MKISDLIKELGLKVITKTDYEDREVSGCYIGDLLSWVMSKASADNIWITVQTNINIVAVATLTDVSCVLIPDGIEVEGTTIEMANKKGVVILGSVSDSFSLAVAVSKML